MSHEKKWVYINLEDYEAEIREDERRKCFAVRSREREWKRSEQNYKHRKFMKSIPYKLLCIPLLVMAYLVYKYSPQDGDAIAIFICMGILGLLIIPDVPHDD